MTHRYPTRYRTAQAETRSETDSERTKEQKRLEKEAKRAKKEEKKRKEQKRAEKEAKRAEKEAKRAEKEAKRAEKEAAETLVQMASDSCDACWREGEVVSVPNCRDECCTMNVCAYGCTFTCFMCEDSWRGTWSDRNDWFWAGYNDETFPVCPTCMPMVSGMPVFRSAAGLFPWTGLWPGVWIGDY